MLYVMLPAYNEQDALPQLLDRFEALFAEYAVEHGYVVVDDGSRDNTLKVAEDRAKTLPMTVLPHGVNKGLGAAMQTGFAHLAEHAADDDIVVTMDADNTHDPALVPAMKDALDAGADVVIASRYAPGGEEVGLNAFRKVLSRGASFVVSTFLPVPGARDYTCGYRMYRVSKIKQAFARYGDGFITETSFVCMAEILVKTAYLPSRVAEVGLVLRYDMKGSPSKMKYLKTIIRYFDFIFREKRKGLRMAAAA